jgi:hypothetical protein
MRTRLFVLSGLISGLLCALAVAASLAAGAPAVTTGAASGVTSSAARVAGTVNPNGTASSYAFQYGTSTSYGQQTSSQPDGSGTATENVSVTLNGLPSGTAIHYRIVATYGTASTVVGNDATFTTSGPPPSVPAPTATTSVATSVSTHSAQLNGTAGPTAVGATYYFQYGTNTNYGVETSPVALSASSGGRVVKATLSGLQDGATYHFRLVTHSSSGLTSTGVDQTFTTTGAATPSVTTGSARSVTGSSARVNGTVNPHGVATSYSFQYGISTSYGEQLSSQPAGSGASNESVSATLSGLPPGTTIHYRIIATFGANNVIVGNDAMFKTTGPPPSVPAPFATTGSATNVIAHGATLNGTVGPTAAGAVYTFQYGPSTAYGMQSGDSSLTASGAARSVSATLSGLESNATYHYRLVTRSSSGLLSDGPDHTFATPTLGRMRPSGLALSTRSTLGRRHVIVRDSGALRLPAGASPQSACFGTVWILIRAGRSTLAYMPLPLSGSCAFRQSIGFAYRRLHHHRRLRVTARFGGNGMLQPISAGWNSVPA